MLLLVLLNRILLYKLACNCGLGLHCLLVPPWVGCGHKIVLSKNMSYGRTCFSGSYAFQDNMCYDSICVEGSIYIYIYLFVTVRVLVAVLVARFL